MGEKAECALLYKIRFSCHAGGREFESHSTPYENAVSSESAFFFPLAAQICNSFAMLMAEQEIPWQPSTPALPPSNASTPSMRFSTGCVRETNWWCGPGSDSYLNCRAIRTPLVDCREQEIFPDECVAGAGPRAPMHLRKGKDALDTTSSEH